MKLNEFRQLETGDIIVRKGKGDKFPVEWRVISVDLGIEQVHIVAHLKKLARYCWISVNPYDSDEEFISACRRQGE